jgi:hypothetical protein
METKRSRRQAAQWVILSVGQDARSIVAAYRNDHIAGPPTTLVEESANAIRVQFQVTGVVGGPELYSFARVTLRFNAPIAGRRIGGPGLLTHARGLSYRDMVVGSEVRVINVVPRVVGLDIDDARMVLESQGFEVALASGSEGEVVAQSPAEECQPTAALVTLRISKPDGQSSRAAPDPGKG